MKATLLLLLAACLFSGCTGSERGLNLSDLPTRPPEPPQKESEARPREPAPPYIYADGEFHNPGRYVWTIGMTLRDAFSAAGGFTDFASKGIYLQHWDGTVEKFRWSSKHPLRNNPALRPGDKVINGRE